MYDAVRQAYDKLYKARLEMDSGEWRAAKGSLKAAFNKAGKVKLMAGELRRQIRNMQSEVNE